MKKNKLIRVQKSNKFKVSKASKTSVYLICIIMFLASMKSVFNDFYEESTSTSVNYVREDEMDLPILTLCAKNPYKEDIYETNLTMEENTLSFHDLFVDESIKKNWTVLEFFTLYNGKCFALTYKEKIKGLPTLATLQLKMANVDIFIGNPGENLWVFFSYFPFTLTSLETNFNENFRYADILITKKGQRFQKNCVHYPEGKCFSTCVKQIMEEDEAFKAGLKCSIPELRGFNISLRPCDSKDEISKIRLDLSYFVWKQISLSAKEETPDGTCKMDCHRYTYEAKMTYFNDKSVYPKEEHYKAFIYYSSMFVEETTESLKYDNGKFLSALGGSMGLFLGFSVATLLTELIEFGVNAMT